MRINSISIKNKTSFHAGKYIRKNSAAHLRTAESLGSGKYTLFGKLPIDRCMINRPKLLIKYFNLVFDNLVALKLPRTPLQRIQIHVRDKMRI